MNIFSHQLIMMWTGGGGGGGGNTKTTKCQIKKCRKSKRLMLQRNSLQQTQICLQPELKTLE